MKIKCVYTQEPNNFTVGKEYELTNRFVSDKGYEYSVFNQRRDNTQLEKWNGFLGGYAKFVEVKEKVKIIQQPKEAVMKLGYSKGDLVTPKKGGLSKLVKMNHLYLVEALGLGVVKLHGIDQLIEGTIFRRKFTANTNLVLQQLIVNTKKSNPAIKDIYIEAFRTVVVLNSGVVGVAKFNKKDKRDVRVNAIYLALARAVAAEQLKIINEKQKAHNTKEA